MSLKQHSLFQTKPKISSKADLIADHLDKHGDKIIVELPLTSIESTPQVRKQFNQNKIKNLADDINDKGLIHPITVMHHPKQKNKYILLIGGNRFLAIQQLNWDAIPCIVKTYNPNIYENELIQLAENMHRQDLNPIELADAVIRIKKNSNYTLAKLAKAIGRTVDSLKQYSRINKLSNSEKEFHIKKGSTKNEILTYLANRDKIKNPPTDEKALLFNNFKTNKYEKLSLNELVKKMNEAEEFLKIAKKIIKNSNSKP